MDSERLGVNPRIPRPLALASWLNGLAGGVYRGKEDTEEIGQEAQEWLY